jgi:hypothetical protein
MGIGVDMAEAPGMGVLYMISVSSSMAAGCMGQGRGREGNKGTKYTAPIIKPRRQP